MYMILDLYFVDSLEREHFSKYKCNMLKNNQCTSIYDKIK